MKKLRDFLILGAVIWFGSTLLSDEGDTNPPIPDTQTVPALVKVEQPTTPNVTIVPQRPIKQAETPPTKTIMTASLPKANKVETTRSIVQTKPIFRYVDASRLNVRNGPDKTNKVIWTLKRDQKVQVDRVEGEWSYVVGSRFKGWVFSTYLTRNPSQKLATATKRINKPKPKGLSTAKIKKILIRRSMAYYSGSCPCPYNRDRGGRKCGRRSAYSRPGGASPLCYSGDVSKQMVADYRAREG